MSARLSLLGLPSYIHRLCSGRMYSSARALGGLHLLFSLGRREYHTIYTITVSSKVAHGRDHRLLGSTGHVGSRVRGNPLANSRRGSRLNTNGASRRSLGSNKSNASRRAKGSSLGLTRRRLRKNGGSGNRSSSSRSPLHSRRNRRGSPIGRPSGDNGSGSRRNNSTLPPLPGSGR